MLQSLGAHPFFQMTRGMNPNVRVVALCATYNRPALVANAMACFKANWERYPRSVMLIYDDSGLYRDSDDGIFWFRSTHERSPSLGAKYNRMVEWAYERWPDEELMFAVWDDDDVYLPNHIAANLKAASEANARWNHPFYVYSDYGFSRENYGLRREPAAGMFHAAVAAILPRDGGPRWPENQALDYDQQFIAMLHKAYGEPGRPDKVANEPTFIFRFGSTGTWHAQYYYGRGPEWYALIGREYAPSETGIQIEPKFDEITERLYAVWDKTGSLNCMCIRH